MIRPNYVLAVAIGSDAQCAVGDGDAVAALAVVIIIFDEFTTIMAGDTAADAARRALQLPGIFSGALQGLVKITAAETKAIMAEDVLFLF